MKRFALSVVLVSMVLTVSFGGLYYWGLLSIPPSSVSDPDEGMTPDRQLVVGPADIELGNSLRPEAIHPVSFSSKDGKFKGWRLVIPGNRPLATPAVVGGKVFIGGGFGSHEFYAFDAASGEK